MIPRARITVRTDDGVVLDTYTCPVANAARYVGLDLEAWGTGCHAVVAHLDGSVVYRVPERDGVAAIPSGGLKMG